MFDRVSPKDIARFMHCDEIICVALVNCIRNILHPRDAPFFSCGEIHVNIPSPYQILLAASTGKLSLTFGPRKEQSCLVGVRSDVGLPLWGN